MSLNEKKAYAALQQDTIQNPPTHTITRASHYDVSPGTAPTFVPFTGTTSRLAVQFNTTGIGIGTSPYEVIIPYRRIGNPTANISVGIRKAAGDTFQLMGQWPTDGYTKATPIITIKIDQG